jgi:rhodanese-related sulfurtransferase
VAFFRTHEAFDRQRFANRESIPTKGNPMTRPPDAASTHPSGPSDELPAVILDLAAQRAHDMNLPYAGAVTPAEAFALREAGVATLVDVRTRFENEYVGRVDGAPLIEWRVLGQSSPNPDFIAQLNALPDKREHLMFLCRSGVRSHAAAIAAKEAGYPHTYNILEGFEGDLDEEKHRGTRGGWRRAGLPWIQS